MIAENTIEDLPVDRRLARQRALQRQVERLGRRLDQMQTINQRFSWYRLVVFILGVVATWLAALYLSQSLTWLTLLASVATFSVVVALHRRLDRWIEKFTIWREIKSSQLARMTLDWDRIPPTPNVIQPRIPLDIDLDLTGPRSLHQLIDLAVSAEGSQRLASWLTHPEPDLTKIEARQKIVQELVGMPRFRERLLLNLRQVSKGQLNGARLLGWLAVDYPRSRLKWLVIVGTLFALLNLTLFVLYNTRLLPPYWILSLTIYAAFYFLNASASRELLESIVAMEAELGVFSALLHYLENYSYGDNTDVASLCAPFREGQYPPSVQLRRVIILTAAVGLRMNPIIGFLLNLALPWDFTCGYLAGNLSDQVAVALPTWLDTWYELEALSSLACFGYLNPEYRFPETGANQVPLLEAIDLGHPLIPAKQKICNDFFIRETGQVFVITGSNMAGKSTFLKTIGINLCLAFAGAPVNAARFRCAALRMHTCMRISDSVVDGYSYFYAEVKCLKRLLEEITSNNPTPLLYLIDEIFRGTNNRERLIGSRAFIRTLIGSQGLGLIATHDLALTDLAAQSPLVSNHHFIDMVEVGRLKFDYKIRPGPCPTTNALKIMQLEGLPVEVE